MLPPMRMELGIGLVAVALLAGCGEKGTCKVKTGSADQCVVNQTRARCDEDKGSFTKEDSAASLRNCESSGYTKTSGNPNEAKRNAEAGQVVWFNK